jgi:hypothetical protein
MSRTCRCRQTALARPGGTTRQRVNQIVASWERTGLVRHHYGSIVLLDVSGLKTLAER